MMSRRQHLADPADERGFVLPLVIIALLLASLLVIPFLNFAKLRYGDLSDTVAFEEAYFAADAGIEAVLADLRRGSDPLDGSYVLPVVSLNGFDASLDVQAPSREAYVPFGSVFSNPEADTSLAPLAAGQDFIYTIDNIKTHADFQVSWAFTPADKAWQITVFEGAGTGGSQMANATKNASPGRLTVAPEDIAGGTYTVRFRNKSTSDLTAEPFSPTGDPQATWIRLTAWKDYLITSTAGDVTLSVFARQSPGPNSVESTVSIATWHGPN